eukprot:4896449-Prymnesium_polylepis.3
MLPPIRRGVARALWPVRCGAPLCLDCGCANPRATLSLAYIQPNPKESVPAVLLVPSRVTE